MFAFLLGWMVMWGQELTLESLPPAAGMVQAPLESRLAEADALILGWAEPTRGKLDLRLQVRRQWKAPVPQRILIKQSKHGFSNRRQLGLAFLAKDEGRWRFLPNSCSWIPLNETQAYVYSKAIEDWQAWRNLKDPKIQQESRLRWLVQLASSPLTLSEVATFFCEQPTVLLELDKFQRAVLLDVCGQEIIASPPELLDFLFALDGIPAFGKHGAVQRTLSFLHHATQTPQPYLVEDHWLYTRQPEISSWAVSNSAKKNLKPPSPGYDGSFCTATGAKVLRELRGKVLAQPAQNWRLVALQLSSPTPHVFSGKRGGKGKGPHAVLSNGEEKYVFPVETDGDAAVLAYAITNKTALQLKGIISPALYRALKADPLPGF